MDTNKIKEFLINKINKIPEGSGANRYKKELNSTTNLFKFGEIKETLADSHVIKFNKSHFNNLYRLYYTKSYKKNYSNPYYSHYGKKNIEVINELKGSIILDFINLLNPENINLEELYGKSHGYIDPSKYSYLLNNDIKGVKTDEFNALVSRNGFKTIKEFNKKYNVTSLETQLYIPDSTMSETLVKSHSKLTIKCTSNNKDKDVVTLSIKHKDIVKYSLFNIVCK